MTATTNNYPTPSITIGLQFTHPNGTAYGIGLGPGVVNPIVDEAGETPGEVCLQVVQQFSGTWGLAEGAAGSELQIGIGVPIPGGTVLAFMTNALTLIQEYFTVTLFAAPASPPPAANLTTVIGVQAAIVAALGLVQVSFPTTTGAPSFTLPAGAITD